MTTKNQNTAAKIVADSNKEAAARKAKADEERNRAAVEAERNQNELKRTAALASSTHIESTYDALIKGEIAVTVETAAAAIAAHFYDPGMVWNRETRTREQGNTLAYTQRDVLNGICWTLNQRIAGIEERADKAREDLKDAQKRFTENEIPINRLQQALEWAERIESQRLETEALREAFERVHVVATGEEFRRPHAVVKQPQASADEAEINRRLAAMLGADAAQIGGNEAQTNGVETQD